MLVIGLGMDWSWSSAFFPSYWSIGPHCVFSSLWPARISGTLSALWILSLEKIKLVLLTKGYLFT
jgi:hypothetical protein